MKLSSRSGMTLLEAMVALAIFSTTLLAFGASLRATRNNTDLVTAIDRLNRQGMRAMRLVRENLERTGFENGFPDIYDGDGIAVDWAQFDHDDALTAEGDVATSCDIVFRHPDDADGDGWPDTLNGEPDWEANPRAITLVPDTDGTNRLVVTDDNGISRTIARSLDTITFETSSDTAFEIPLDCVRVTFNFLAPMRSGPPAVAQFSMVVRLKNGGFEQ